MAYRLGGTVSPRMQVFAAIIFFVMVIVLVTGFWLVYEFFGYVPRWLIGIVGISVFIFSMIMTKIGRKDVKYNDD